MTDIRSAHKAIDGPFFSNCKAHGAKVLPTVYQGIGGIFFVTREPTDTSWPVFIVWQYETTDNRIKHIGKSTGNDYKATLQSARAWAKLKAKGTVSA